MGSFGKPRSSRALQRKSFGFDELTRILIVCEGSKTEPFYFKSMVSMLALRATSILVLGRECDSAPISVYEYAAKRYADDPDFDFVYCVFDRDRHATYDAACSAIRNHPSKILKAIVSNPCFEYWILLHFIFTRSPFNV